LKYFILLVFVLGVSVQAAGQLYGVGPFDMLRVDPTRAYTFVEAQIPLGNGLEMSGSSTLDYTAHTYYAPFYTPFGPLVLGMNTDTGVIAKIWTVPAYPQYLDFDEITETMFMTYYNQTAAATIVLAMDAIGSISELAAIADVLPFLGQASAFDRKTSTLFVALGSQANGSAIYEINTQTGTMKKHIPDGMMMDVLVFSPSTGLIYGLGFDPSTESRLFVSLNPQSSKFTKLGATLDFAGEMAGIATMDDIDAIFYCVMSNKTDTTTFHLVSIDAKNGQVMAAPTSNMVPDIFSLAFLPNQQQFAADRKMKQ
jgi:hypothetical protein